MKTEEILKELAEEVGKPLARFSEPSYWSFEDMDRAKRFQPLARAARWAYRRIKDGESPKEVLTWLKGQIKTGIEANAINMLLNKI